MTRRSWQAVLMMVLATAVLLPAEPAAADYTMSDGTKVEWKGGDTIKVTRPDGSTWEGTGNRVGDRLYPPSEAVSGGGSGGSRGGSSGSRDRGGSSGGGSSGNSSAFDRMNNDVQKAKEDWWKAQLDYADAHARGDQRAMEEAQRRMNEAHERAENARNDYRNRTGLDVPEWLLSSGTGRREDHDRNSAGGGFAEGHADTGAAGSNYRPPESYAALGYGTLAGFTPLLVDGKPVIGTDGKPVMVAQFAANQNKGAGGTISAIPADRLTPQQLQRFRDAGFAVEGNMILVSTHYYAATGTGGSGPKADVGWKASAPGELNMVTPTGAVSPDVADTLLSTFPDGNGWAWSYDTRTGIIRTPGGIVDISFGSPGGGGSGGGGGPSVIITPPETVPVSILSVTATPNPVTEGQSLTLTVKTMGPVTQGLATFGWGQQSRLSGAGDTWTATVTAPAAPQEKTYPITVVVAGDRGQTATRQASVTVRPAPPNVRSVTLSPNPIKFADILTVSVELTGRATTVTAYVQYRRPDYEQKGGSPVIPLTQVAGQAPGTTVWRGTKKVDWITLDEWQDVMAERTLDPYTVTVTAEGPTGRETAPGQVTIQGTTIWVVPVPD